MSDKHCCQLRRRMGESLCSGSVHKSDFMAHCCQRSGCVQSCWGVEEVLGGLHPQCSPAEFSWCNSSAPGYWVAPPCDSDPGRCLEILLVDPWWDTGYIERLSKNNGLEVVVAYAGSGPKRLRAGKQHERRNAFMAIGFCTAKFEVRGACFEWGGAGGTYFWQGLKLGVKLGSNTTASPF